MPATAKPRTGRAATPAPGAAEAPSPFRAAGGDPAKRAQILAGAQRVFLRLGYDAASMNDITREAGVSKATVYAYFPGKEDLFATLVEGEREKHRAEFLAGFDEDMPVAEALAILGNKLATFLCADLSLRANRYVLGVTQRMPEVGRRFYQGGAGTGLALLQAYLDRKVASGALAIPDTALAANQFIELCQAGLVRTRLYAAETEPADRAEIARVVGSAVRLFLAGYGTARG